MNDMDLLLANKNHNSTYRTKLFIKLFDSFSKKCYYSKIFGNQTEANFVHAIVTTDLLIFKYCFMNYIDVDSFI